MRSGSSFEHNGKILEVFKIGVTESDGSLYLFPYAKFGKYFVAIQEIGMSGNRFETDVDLAKHLSAKDIDIPKISIHQSGNVHADIAGVRVGPLSMGMLSTLRDEL